MKFELDDYHRNVSEEDLIADLKRVAHYLSKNSVTRREYKKHGKYSSNTLGRRFRSWNKSLEAAGLVKNIVQNISEEEFFSNLQEVWIKLGRQPRYDEMKKPLSKFSTSGYDKHFGGWRPALKKFVDFVNGEKPKSLEKIVENSTVDIKAIQNGPRDISLRLRFLVMRRDNFKCRNCGRSPATDAGVVLHIDHVTAWANGGKTVFENLQTLCSDCNLGKSDLKL